MDCLEIVLALRLESLGQPPVVVAPLAHKMMIEYWHDAEAEMAGKRDDLYVIIYAVDTPPEDYARLGARGKPPVWFFRGIDRMPEIEKHLPLDIERINVSGHARRIFSALEKVVPDR